MFASPWADAPCRPQDVGKFLKFSMTNIASLAHSFLESFYQEIVIDFTNHWHTCTRVTEICVFW